MRKPLAASAVVVVAVALAGAAAQATETTAPAVHAVTLGNPAGWLSVTCPTWYGFSNPANGCEPWARYLAPNVRGAYSL